jgi:hypothetical protein
LRQRGESLVLTDDLRRRIWPLLLEIDPNSLDETPLLAELTKHSEYDQVVLDVNRSLKRFPPGIPYKQRLALQDQLTVLILQVIIKYPHLRYYQGYHDVAITFLLVVGEQLGFSIMERLSTDHLRECMEPTMEKTSYRLTYIYPLLSKVDPQLYEFMERYATKQYVWCALGALGAQERAKFKIRKWGKTFRVSLIVRFPRE